jgi:hypothetical protein
LARPRKVPGLSLSRPRLAAAARGRHLGRVPPSASPAAPRRRCVFTSAGDRNAVAAWLPPGGGRDFDLFVAFYGEDAARFAELSRLSDRAWRIKGGKAQNLRTLVLAGELDLSPYSHVWLPDDDLLLDPRDIPRLFDLAEHFGFAVCQPAFDPLGRVTWPVTAAAPSRDQARLTDFVEITCPLFRREELERFLAVFDGSLSGWGLDLWFAHVLGADTPGRFAVLDAIAVINPHHRHKPGGEREIDRLRPLPARIAEFAAAARRVGLPPAERGRCFGTLPLPPGWRQANPPLPPPPGRVLPSEALLSPGEQALLAAALSPAPSAVLQSGLGGLTAALLAAGAALVAAEEPDEAWLASCRADPAFAAALADGRLLALGSAPCGEDAPRPLRGRPGAPPLLVAPAAGFAQALARAEALAAQAALPPPSRALLSAAAGAEAPQGWHRAAAAGRLLLAERPRADPPAPPPPAGDTRLTLIHVNPA